MNANKEIYMGDSSTRSGQYSKLQNVVDAKIWNSMRGTMYEEEKRWHYENRIKEYGTKNGCEGKKEAGLNEED